MKCQKYKSVGEMVLRRIRNNPNKNNTDLIWFIIGVCSKIELSSKVLSETEAKD